MEKRKAMFGRMEEVINTENGNEYLFAGMIKPDVCRIVTPKAWKSACKRLATLAQNEPEEVKGGPLMYLTAEEREKVSPTKLVSKASFETVLNDPAKKKLIDRVSKLDGQISDLLDKVSTLESEKKELSKQIYV